MKKLIKVFKDKEFKGSVCSLYGELDCNRFIDGAMTPLEIERFDAHAENCNECLRLLRHCNELRMNAEGVRRAMDVVNKIDK